MFGKRQGTPITEQQARTLSTYTSNGWSELLWTTNNDTSYPKLIPGGYSTFEGINSGVKISVGQAKQKQTYTSLTDWDMESDWYIKEGVSYPELIKRSSDIDWGIPGTHSMTYRYVIPHVDGTAQWLGVKWMHQKMFYQYPIPPASSPIGAQVTYEVGNLEQRIFVDRENKEVDLVFIFSGVSDFKGAAGYAYYTDELVRTVEVHPERAATVNFYFTEPKYLPSTNYKLSVSTPEGVVDVTAVAESNYSPIRFVADTGEIWGIPLVDIHDEKATPVRVATDDGFKAFKQYEEFSEIEMLEGDEWKWE